MPQYLNPHPHDLYLSGPNGNTVRVRKGTYMKLSSFFDKYVSRKSLSKVQEPPKSPYKIAKIVDQWGWAYHFLSKEQQRYTTHDLVIQKHNETNLDGLNAVYIHGPDISPEARGLPLIAKESGIKVIGGHAGPTKDMPVFEYLDLAVGISPETFEFANENYNCPKVFLPEGIDTEFFKPYKEPAISNWPPPRVKKLIVGWAGREDKVKRTHLLNKLDYPIKIQSDHKAEFFVINRTLNHMVSFYNSIDVLIMVSSFECMPRVVLEACACGIPVVCTDVGSIRMILDDDWIIPANPEWLVIDEMNKRLHKLEDKNLRAKVGLANRERIEKTLSWKILSPFWDMAFSAVIEGNFSKINTINKHFGK